MPLSSVLANVGILAVLGTTYLALLALGIAAVARARPISFSKARGFLLSTAVWLAIFIAVTVAADAIGASLRLDLVVGRLPREDAGLLQSAIRVGLAVLYVVVVVAAFFWSRPLMARLGADPGSKVVVPASVAAFILLTMPFTDLLHSCYVQSTVAFASRC